VVSQDEASPARIETRFYLGALGRIPKVDAPSGRWSWGMDHAPTANLLVPLVMSAVAALGFVQVFSSMIRNETTLHDLRRRVKEIQYGRALINAERKGMIRLDDDEDPGEDRGEDRGEVEVPDHETQPEAIGIDGAQDAPADTDESLSASAA